MTNALQILQDNAVKDAVKKAVREEREAVVRYLQRVSSDESWIDAQTAIPWIARGDHRK